jgi:hypothetical protein
MLLDEKWYSQIGKKLRDERKDVAEEPLPQRWVDLIRYLRRGRASARSRA